MRALFSAVAWACLALTVDIGAASAQQRYRLYKIGWLWIGSPGLVEPPMEAWTGPFAAFRDALKNRDYVLGRNLVVDARYAHGDVARLAAEAESLVASEVDLIVTFGTAPTVAAARATRTIPIIFAGMADPVARGLVASLARPGGNLTGMVTAPAGAKLWQLLRDVSPTTRRGASLYYLPNLLQSAVLPVFLANERARAAEVGMVQINLGVSSHDELGTRFAELAGEGAAGVVVHTDDTLFLRRSSIIGLALRYRLPTVCSQAVEWAQDRCLATYAEDLAGRFRGAVAQVDKILRGANPADIPVEQPTSFRLIINAKTAKALDVAVPPSALAAADEVIE